MKINKINIELEPIINDSWARGAIPVKQFPKRKSIASDKLLVLE